MNQNEMDNQARSLWTRFDIHRWLPSRGNVLFTLLVVASLFVANRAGALTLAAPTATSTTTIPYQGRLADTGGNPLTGTYAMTFRLYAVASGGATLWTEAWTGGTAVHVSDGLFNVILGSFTPIPQSVVTANSTLWLGITVGADAEMLPRVQLGSAPFAVQALTVPDGSVTTAKIADGAVTARKAKSSIYTVEYEAEATLSIYSTWVDLPPLTLTIPAMDVPVATTAMVFFDARCSSNQNLSAVAFSTFLDGEYGIYTDAYPIPSQMMNFSLHDVITLSPNTDHIMKMRWKYFSSAGTALCASRKLTVILIGQ